MQVLYLFIHTCMTLIDYRYSFKLKKYSTSFFKAASVLSDWLDLLSLVGFWNSPARSWVGLGATS